MHLLSNPSKSATRNLRAGFVILFAYGSSLQASVSDLAKEAAYQSVDAFVAVAKEFQPATAPPDAASLFTVTELGQPDDPKTGQPVTATAIESSAALWSDKTDALVFVCATPRTESTRSSVGVLFFLHRGKDSWHIADRLKFVASGKYAEVTAELSAGTGTGYQLSSASMLPIVTVTESHGGRGYAYRISASYTIHQSKLQRRDLE